MPQSTSPFDLPLSASAKPSTQAPGQGQIQNQAPDLSNLAPREMADRLFNRIMTSSESGNTKEALVFVPMGIEAYKKLEFLDNDARYHLALIYLTAGDIENAREQIKQLRKSVPKHLMGYMLEHQIAGINKHQKNAGLAYKNFLSAYETEFLMDRKEYRDHQGNIDRFRIAAQASRENR